MDLNGPDETKSCFRLTLGDEAQKHRRASDHLLRSLAASVPKEVTDQKTWLCSSYKLTNWTRLISSFPENSLLHFYGLFYNDSRMSHYKIKIKLFACSIWG